MKVGLQLWTVYDLFQADPLGTLRKVADAGYRYVEITNHTAQNDPGSGAGVSARDLKRVADECGIRVTSAHVMPSEIPLIEKFYYDEDQLKRTAEYYQELGSMAIAIPVDYFPTKDYLLRRCEAYNKTGELLKRYGLKFLWHCHFYDFQEFDGKSVLDIMMEHTDPDVFGIELDAYWIIRGAMNPCEVIRKYKDRIVTMHEKDFPYDQLRHIDAWTMFDRSVPMNHEQYWSLVRPGFFTEIGTGAMNIQSIVDAANEAGSIQYVFVEQEYTRMDKIDSITLSLRNFKKIRGLEWD